MRPLDIFNISNKQLHLIHGYMIKDELNINRNSYVVNISYDPKKITYDNYLFSLKFKIVGCQYRHI